jgi:kumamolisin
MMAYSNKVALVGSERTPMSGAKLVGPTDPSQMVQVSIVLKPRRPLQAEELQGRILSHDEFAATYGADPQQMQQVSAFASANKLTVIEIPDAVARRTVMVEGTTADVEEAFSVKLNDYNCPEGVYRGRTGSILLPAEIVEIVQGVFGLDNRSQAKPHIRFRGKAGVTGSAASSTPDITYTPIQVAELYSFPSGVTGAGQTIGIIELGGGYQEADITNYFQSLGLTPPTVTSVSVDGGTNSPTTPDSADGEVLLDIEVSGAVAPGANIVVYFTTNTSQGFQDALSAAIHDSTNNPSVVSISWGGPESSWTSQLLQSFNLVAQDAAALGVTITVAAGDNGSSDGVSNGSNNVDFPASSPNVLACGGTTLISSNGTITSETVWNDGADGGATGGGFSDVFAQPSYQSSLATTYAGQTGRGVPDVAGVADPDTGYEILVDGEQEQVGGTSAVAPLWAGLVALLNQQLNTRLGFLNPSLYTLPETQAFHEITQGNNGAFSAGPGWNPCTGLGSPIGTAIESLLASAQSSGGSGTGNGVASSAGNETGKRDQMQRH